ncbi:hypothetical protein ACFOWE_12225, partial [Planomonospora corallina]
MATSWRSPRESAVQSTAGAPPAPSARRRPGTAGSRAALDLGTARTRLLLSGTLTVVDRPSAVPASPAGDGVHGAPRMLRPIRHGMVSSTEACARLARTVLRGAAPHGAPPLEHVLLGVPVAASALDRRAAST